MSGKAVQARLQLIRLPNLFTAMADVLAGTLIVSGSGFRWGILGLLLLSTASLYAAGCVLNDLRDMEIDRQERPTRPLPSGRVSRREATLLCGALFGVGLGAALASGWTAFFVAIALAGLILAYDTGAKHHEILGPATMGACRAVNLLLGMAPSLFGGGPLWIFPVFSFIYVFLLTRLSRFEVEGGEGVRLRWVAQGWLTLVLGLLLLVAGDLLRTDALPYLLALVLFTAPALFRGVIWRQPALLGDAVKMLVLGIPLLDAVYVSGVQGWAYALPVVLLLIPSVGLARILYVT